MLGPLGQGTRHVHSKLWYTILGPGGWGYSATHLDLEPSAIWVTTNGLKRWVVSFWSPELRSFWLASTTDQELWLGPNSEVWKLCAGSEIWVNNGYRGDYCACSSSWSQPELLIYDADHNNHISGKENWIARSEWNRSMRNRGESDFVATIGDKIVETLLLNRVISKNKRIRTPPLSPPVKVGCLLFSIGI